MVNTGAALKYDAFDIRLRDGRKELVSRAFKRLTKLQAACRTRITGLGN
ncbi:hypothetical protein GCM10023067_56240 [Aminobacter aganoensis]